MKKRYLLITTSATLLVFTTACQSEKSAPTYKEPENVAVDPTTDPGFGPNPVVDVWNSTYVYDRNEKAFEY